MEQTRLYPDMTAEEQLQWVTDFEALMQDGGGRIVSEARRRQPQWLPEDAPMVRRLVGLLAAWPFAQDFAEKARRYGDYMARATRLPVYVDKVMERLADGLTMTDKDGRTVAYVSPSAPLRRRGRPSREELAARQRGEQPQGAEPDDAEARRRRTVARMLGLDVIVSGAAPREKNNAELKAERDRRRAEYERQNPSLFGAQPSDTVGTVPAVGSDRQERTTEGLSPSVSPAPQSGTSAYRVKVSSHDAAPTAGEVGQFRPAAGSSVKHAAVPQQPLQCPTMSEVYQSRIDQDRLRLSDLAWLCSDELRQRIPTVQGLRVTAESASERAKTMADLGQPADAIAPYAQQAKEAVEGYMAIYQAVDEELATVFYRLQNDEPFREKFLRRFKGVDLVKVSHICRPYYEKLRSPELDLRIRTLIEQESPEYAAKMKAEEAKKEEVSDILRYLKRKDKMATDVRLKSAKEVKFPRLVELIGEKEAMNYYPLITYIEEENRKLHEAEDKEKASEPVSTQEKVKEDKPKKPVKKSADKSKTTKKKDGQ